jgi:hypothetical protein
MIAAVYPAAPSRYTHLGTVRRLASAPFACRCAAGVAAFNPGSIAGIFTAAAALLTVGAVWATKELQSAARLLFGAAFVADRGMLGGQCSSW